VLSSTDEPAKVLAAVRAGASGYLVKTSLESEILEGIRRVSEGQLVFPPELADRVFAELRSSAAVSPVASADLAVCGGTALDREGLARVLTEVGFRVVARCPVPEDLTQLMRRTPAEVALVDTADDPAWIDCLQEARSTDRGLGVLILSDETDSSEVIQLIAAGNGGVGQLFKRRVANIDQVATAVGRVASGEVALDPDVVKALVETPRSASQTADPIGELTERELAVLALMAEGYSNTAIGERLFLSSRTVEAHTSTIFSKLGLEATANTHRRVLAVVAYLRSRHGG
jgi:DNA-binding NarL/FixJ family response regulator